MPGSRKDYWLPKLTRNIERDLEHRKELKKLGWKMLVIWECELKNLAKVEAKLARFLLAKAPADRGRQDSPP